jgi:hypothetical protein
MLDNIRFAKQRLLDLKKKTSREFIARVNFLETPNNPDGYYGASAFLIEFNSANYFHRGTGKFKCQFTWPVLDQFEEGLRLALDMIGIYPDVKALYDAIPFSWLVDWFFPIGDLIDSRVQRGWITPTIKISGCISQKVIFRGSFTETYLGTKYTNGFVRYESYRREPILEYSDFAGDDYAPEFSLDKGLILADLARAFAEGRRSS